ncbi:hypothetical protein HN587_07510 [Candidatus Woesearchaeota archaeon]|nr:hypothetical protein [Candidatus Woesearchaeota archaeon]
MHDRLFTGVTRLTNEDKRHSLEDVLQGRPEAEVATALKAATNTGEIARVYMAMPIVPGVTNPIFNTAGQTLFAHPIGAENTSGVLEVREGIFPLEQAGFSFIDHGPLYGDGVFEGVLHFAKPGLPELLRNDETIFLFREHVNRHYKGLTQWGIKPYLSQEEFGWRILQTALEVKEQAASDQSLYFRPLVLSGIGDLGAGRTKCVLPTMGALVATIQLYPSETYRTGIKLGISSVVAKDPRSLDPNVKGTQYAQNIQAFLHGTNGGEFKEALMFNGDGYLTEATVDNIFFVIKENGWETDPNKVEIITPHPKICLNGLTRRMILHLADHDPILKSEAEKLANHDSAIYASTHKGYQIVNDAMLTAQDMWALIEDPNTEMFMTGTGCGLMPVIGIKDKQVGDGQVGPVTKGFLADITVAMRHRDYGLRLDVTESEYLDYMRQPDLF